MISAILNIRVGIVENANHECILGLIVDAGVVLIAEFDSIEFKVAASLALLYIISKWDIIVVHLKKLEFT